MKNTLKTILLGLILVTGGLTSCTSSDENKASKTALSGEEVLLRYHATEGDEYAMVMDVDMKMGEENGMKMNLKMDMDYKVGEVSADKSYYNSSTIKRVVMKMNMAGMDVSYDSDSETHEGMGATMHTIYSKMIGVEIKSKSSNRGEILESPNFNEIFGDQEAIKKQMSESMDKVSSSAIEYPEEAVKVGSTWSKLVTTKGKFPMDLNTTYTVKEITDTEVILSVSGDMKMKNGETDNLGKLSGESIIDIKTGFLKSMTMNQNMEMDMMGKKMDMKNNIKMTMTKK